MLVEKPVYTERIVEKPIYNRIERPVEVLVKNEIPVTRTVDKRVTRNILKPIRTELV